MSAEIEREKYTHKTILLWMLCAISLIAMTVFYLKPHLTGSLKMDGGIGVLLGLYICSHPAANFLDMLLFGRGPWRAGASGWEITAWITHNLLVMGLGWIVIFSGTLRFTTK